MANRLRLDKAATLRQLRGKRTPTEMAAALGIGRPHYYRLESGAVPIPERVLKLARLLKLARRL